MKVFIYVAQVWGCDNDSFWKVRGGGDKIQEIIHVTGRRHSIPDLIGQN